MNKRYRLTRVSNSVTPLLITTCSVQRQSNNSTTVTTNLCDLTEKLKVIYSIKGGKGTINGYILNR